MDAVPNEQVDERAVKRRQQSVARVLRHRKRAREGGVVFRMEIDGPDIAALIAVGTLDANDSRNPIAVCAAVKKLSVEGWRARRQANAAPRISEANRQLLASLEDT
jgi:hypothetical protein